MNIDLLFTNAGESGLISSENLVKKIAGVVFDTQNGVLTLEFVDMDYLELNIPVDGDFFGFLERSSQMHVGAIKGGQIAQAYQAPLMFMDDPYRKVTPVSVKQSAHPLLGFDNFVKACVRGQPVHREDLGDEDAMGCVLGEAIPSALQFAPHLARRHAMESTPKAVPAPPTRGPRTEL